jgi:ABC-type amino acid transport substrate-binding protein
MKVGSSSGARGVWMRGAAVLATSLVLLSAAGGCSMTRSRSSATALPAELRVGITPNYPPLALKDGGALKGVEVDFSVLLGKQLGVQIKMVELPWEELIPALVDGKIDIIMSGMSITAARTEYIDFTVPYMTIGQMALVRKVELPRRRDQSDLDLPTSKVGVLQNTTGDYYARRSLKQASVMGFTTVEEGVAALRSGQIDFFLSDAPTIWQITSRGAVENQDLGGIYRPLTTEYLAWGVRQGDDVLRRQLNTTLLNWEQAGQIHDVLDDWINTRRVTLQMK